MKQSRFEKEALQSIQETLKPLMPVGEIKVDTDYRIQGTSLRADAVLKMPKKLTDKRLIIETKASGEPRIIRNAALQLKRYLEYFKQSYGIVVAPYISAQSANICKEENVGYLDLSGNCLIKFDNIYIERSGKPNRFVVRKKQRTLFSDKSTRVIRALLSNPKKCWGVRELAKEIDVSPGYVSRIKQNLLDQEWLVMGRDDICLNDPKSVLDEWVRAGKNRKEKSFEYFSLKKPSEIENEIARYCQKNKINYALTGFSAAIRYAPMVPSKSVSSYIDGDIQQIADALGLKLVDSGANVTLLEPYDDGIFYELQTIDGVQIVSPIQVYLDLINVKGRGEEAANAVFEKKVGSQW